MKRKGKTTLVSCENCKKEFEALLIKRRIGKGKFCSVKCYRTFRENNKLDEKEANRLYQKKNKYGLSKEDYYNLLEKSKGKCNICDNLITKPNIDHDHKTNRVRGILCHHCNVGLGNFKDSVKLLQRAINYLNKHEKE